jgi:hypothetical protein
LINEQNKSIAELWDGNNLRCTFRRCVNIRLFQLWEEVVSIAESISLTMDEDEMVWQFQSSGSYSTQSLYRVINFRGGDPCVLACSVEIANPPYDSLLSMVVMSK